MAQPVVRTWEMHGVRGWDSANNAGAVLRWPQGTLCFYSVLIGPSVGRAALTTVQVDWYTGLYYPLKRWTERVCRSVANGRGHEKSFFAEPIPNEVSGGLLHLDACHLTHDCTSFVHHDGHHNTNPQTRYLHLTS
jgi:hypothetical protein